MESIILPPTFTGLYRLFLRTAAASVLHKRAACSRIRRLWRPTFEVAAQVIRRHLSVSTTDPERRRLEWWYRVWERRIDNTLSLLAVSAQSRGLAHRLTSNLNLLQREHEFQATRLGAYEHAHYWNPKLPVMSEYYQPKPMASGPRANRKEDKKDRWRKLDMKAWGALGEAITMAEGRDGISLGRIKNGS
ncbi:hypothetical protein IEO21_03881 [Rhodonia placenta]|uniref:Uncharacterized protein n=1 Tax=Rhodonia placenta TaxID=104341 RepID=A0A8H7P582_9APHY|nr:hypothetical protein IEO21_03881 [Postia placenta]